MACSLAITEQRSRADIDLLVDVLDARSARSAPAPAPRAQEGSGGMTETAMQRDRAATIFEKGSRGAGHSRRRRSTFPSARSMS